MHVPASGQPEDVGSLRREVELLRLDQEWEQRRRKLLLGGENGTVPTRGASLLALCCGLVFAGFCFFAAFYLIPQSAGPKDNTIPIVMGVIGLLGGFVSACYIAVLSDRYEKVHRRYEQRRKELMGQHSPPPA